MAMGPGGRGCRRQIIYFNLSRRRAANLKCYVSNLYITVIEVNYQFMRSRSEVIYFKNTPALPLEISLHLLRLRGCIAAHTKFRHIRSPVLEMWDNQSAYLCL